jgi:hypothetical protein
VIVGVEGEVFGAVVCLTLWSFGNGGSGGSRRRRRSGFLVLGLLAWCCLLGSGNRLGSSFEGFMVPFYIVK